MPAIVVQQTHQQLPLFAVIGQYADNTEYVRHTGLLANAGHSAFGEAVEVRHMAPPLCQGAMKAHVAGWVDDLTREEEDGIETWLELTTKKLSPFGRFRQYIVRPSWDGKDVTDQVSEQTAACRFSCIGLVLRAYDEGAFLPLVEEDEAQLPLVALETLREIYGADGVADSRRRTMVGLEGDGPWPVMLPGYVMHALNRPAEQIRANPFQPNDIEQRRFP